MFELFGAAAAAVGVGTSIFGAILGNDANQEALAAQQKAEQIRQAQAAADAERRRRQAIRTGIIQRSQALANATAQGANESTANSGAQGQVNQETGWTIGGINTAQAYGTALYGANQELLQAKMDQANADEWSSIGKSLTSLGGGLVTNAGTIGNIANNNFNFLSGVGKPSANAYA